MVNKYLVIQLLHKNCGIDHTEERHRYDAIVYSNRVNDTGLDATAEQVARAIIQGVRADDLVQFIDAERNGFPPVS